ncbi:hypothetical protein LCGC14_2143560 [marine sediment metagenome]|uniref:30S ribosomal protein S21 n=1 Tax=marine sediment metagenome TaxID=412755 RepID=A0A0F9DY04_9ZZZZ
MNKSTNMVVIGQGHRSFDTSLKRFLKMTSDIVLEDKRRQYFSPTPTRNARRLRGKILERRKREQEEVKPDDKF